MTIKLNDIVKDVKLGTKVGSTSVNSLANFLYYVMNKFENIKEAQEKAEVQKMAAKAQRTMTLWGNVTANAALNKTEKASKFYQDFLKEAANIKGALDNEEIKKLVEVGTANKKAKLEARKAAKAAKVQAQVQVNK